MTTAAESKLENILNNLETMLTTKGSLGTADDTATTPRAEEISPTTMNKLSSKIELLYAEIVDIKNDIQNIKRNILALDRLVSSRL